MFYLIQLLNAVQYGLLLFLLASGLTLIFGIMGVINLAHGSFYMVGAYLAYWLAQMTGSLWLAIPIGAVIAFVIGLVLETTLFSRLYKRDHLYQVLLTFGLILVFEELRSILFGDEVHGVAVPKLLDFSLPLTETLSYPAYRLFVTVVCLLIAAAMYFVIQKTRIGMMVRAGNSNREMAASLGVNIRLLFAMVFCHRHGAGGAGGNSRGADLVGVSRHGQSNFDHLFRRGRHRRHRLDQRRADRVFADRPRRYPGQSARPGIFRRRGLSHDGADPFVAPPRAGERGLAIP